MGNTRTDRRKIYLVAAAIIALVSLVSAGFFFLRMWEEKQAGTATSGMAETYREYGGKEYELRDDVETFLVLGLDKFGEDITANSYNNDRQSDFLMLFVFDNEAKTCSALHINRDTMAQMNVLGLNGNPVNTVTKQIALAHTYGDGGKQSCYNVADAVSTLLLGMKIDHYMSVTMDAVPLYNDLLGGVEVTVLDDFTGIDDTLVQGETVTLMGQHALTYVRSRYGLDDSSNNTRQQRQRQYLKALYAKTVEKIDADEEFIVESTVKLADHMVSDRSVTQLQELMRKLKSYTFSEIEAIKGQFETGEQFMEFYPDKDSVEETVIKLFYQPKN